MSAAIPTFLAAATALLPAVEKHCLPCHGGDKVEARFDLRGDVTRSQWHEAVGQVDREEMPPRQPEPEPEVRKSILAWLETRMAAAPDPVRPPETTHVRLTRDEYSRSVRALLGIDLRPGDLLEPDPQGETGFANDARSLQVTASQAAKYLDAAGRTIDGWFALHDPSVHLGILLEAEDMDRSSPHLKDFDHGVLFATEPQVISSSIEIPVDGYYEIRFHGSTMGKPTRLQILDGTEVIASIPVTRQRPVSVTHRVSVLLRKGWRNLSFNQLNLVPQASLPRDADQVMNERAARNRMQVPELPPDAPPGHIQARKVLEDKCFFLQQAFEWLFAYGTDGDPRDIVRFRDYALERITGEREARHWYAGEILGVDVARFDQQWEQRNGAIQRGYTEHLAKIAAIKWMDWTQDQGQLYLDWIEIEGPFAPDGTTPLPSRDIDVAGFARKAWRRDPAPDEFSRYETAREALGGNENALRQVLAAILASPHFVFRDNRDPATRLSYFLTGAPPDTRTAATDWSNQEDVLATIRRLMGEPGFVESLATFTGQWLETSPLGTTYMPDEYRFPNYKRHTALAAREEPVRFFLRLVRENRPLLELLDSDWTMIDDSLASFYGLPPADGEDWRVARWPDDRRGGLLGMSAVLTTTSSPVRTTPVARGKWVWETLLGRNPGTPLPDAGVLPAMAGEEGLTLREELQRHREDPRCMRCHEKLDPIGLSLENFDAVGQWRDRSAGQPIDAFGKFFHGSAFDGPQGLRGQLMLHQDEFLEELIHRLLAYAHGRSCDNEFPWIETIADRVKQTNWSATSLIEETARTLVSPGPP